MRHNGDPVPALVLCFGTKGKRVKYARKIITVHKKNILYTYRIYTIILVITNVKKQHSFKLNPPRLKTEQLINLAFFII